ncbi:nicotinate-nucleotide--dimethylbenzimidazole phosphoribosyltransferase [Micromonospora sp. HUAS YX12]|uniref:Nicotinate-nucleotide--dimethylbenzimidazole phosphoribosyltransferase n=1 Tax=Micromonospora sp. HUAS YX12 TaxID=3156396 RepID=A0AAU7R2R1_9ACTN
MLDQREGAGRGATSETVAGLCAAVPLVDARCARLAKIMQLTRALPAGSLGVLDDLTGRIAAIRAEPTSGALPAIVSVLAGDHGVAVHGTSAYEHGFTGRVLRLIASGRAPVNILAAQVPARVEYADVGLVEPVGDPRYRVAAGTADLSRQDAMTGEQAHRAVLTGARYAAERLADRPLLGIGEIGVGNTTAATALAARLLGVPPTDLVGPGSGVGPAVVQSKRTLIEAALDRIGRLPDDPIRILAAVGGLEIAANVGVILAAAANRQVIVFDGTITAVSALTAVRLCPAVAGYLIPAHCSTEPVHRHLLEALGQPPLLDLGMRLGMASGAALALSLVNGALAVAHLTPEARAVDLAVPRGRESR